MLEMFQNSQWWELVLMFLFGAVILVGAVASLASIIRRNKIGFSFGKGKVQVSASDDPTGTVQRKHPDCPYWQEILLIIEYQTDAIKRITRIEEIQTIKEQMGYAEQKMGEIRGMLRKVFLKVLRNVRGSKENLVGSAEAIGYENVLKILTYEMLNEFRFIFRENHIVDIEGSDFEMYLRSKVGHLQSRITELLNELYIPGVNPSRERLYDENQEIVSDINEAMEEVIRHGRQIGLARQKDIEAIRSELRTKIERLIGDTDAIPNT